MVAPKGENFKKFSGDFFTFSFQPIAGLFGASMPPYPWSRRNIERASAHGHAVTGTPTRARVFGLFLGKSRGFCNLGVF